MVQGIAGQSYFPDEMTPMAFYQPLEQGYESEMAKALARFKQLRNKRRSDEKQKKDKQNKQTQTL